jgi:hypothetical protein
LALDLAALAVIVVEGFEAGSAPSTSAVRRLLHDFAGAAEACAAFEVAAQPCAVSVTVASDIAHCDRAGLDALIGTHRAWRQIRTVRALDEAAPRAHIRDALEPGAAALLTSFEKV